MRKVVVVPEIKRVVTLCWNGRFNVGLQVIASLQQIPRLCREHSMLTSDCHTKKTQKHTTVKTCCNW